MRTMSQHIFDLVQNSINANAKNIHVIIEENISKNLFKIIIKDDGYGIKSQSISKVKEPFYTTRSHNKRKIGLGLSLMDAMCNRTGGKLIIESKERNGATITAIIDHDNIDRPPLEDISDLFTFLMLSTIENKIIFTLEHIFNNNKYIIKNRMIKDELNVLSFNEPDIKNKLYTLIKKKEKNIHH